MPGFGAFFDYLKIILGLLHAAGVYRGIYFLENNSPLFYENNFFLQKLGMFARTVKIGKLNDF